MSTLCEGKDAVSAAVTILGGCKATANAMNVTRQTVWNWTKRGIPAPRVKILASLVDHQVSAEDMRPDVFLLPPQAG